MMGSHPLREASLLASDVEMKWLIALSVSLKFDMVVAVVGCTSELKARCRTRFQAPLELMCCYSTVWEHQPTDQPNHMFSHNVL